MNTQLILDQPSTYTMRGKVEHVVSDKNLVRERNLDRFVPTKELLLNEGVRHRPKLMSWQSYRKR